MSVGGQSVDSNGVSGSGYIKVVYLRVSVNQNGTIQGENSFRVQISNTSQDSEIGSGADQTGYGYRTGNLSNGQIFTQQIVFGVDESCTNYRQTRSGTIEYRDMDANNSAWNPNIRMIIQRETWVDARNNVSNWQTAKDGSGNNDIFTTGELQANENGQFPTQPFDNHYRYRLLIQAVGKRNTIFIAMDGGISQISGKYNLTPFNCATFTCTATPDPMDATDTKVLVTITNKGPYPFGKGFQVRQTPDREAWPTDATGGFTSDFVVNGSATHSFTRPADATETYTLYDSINNDAIAVPFGNGKCSTSGSVKITCSAAAPSLAEVGQTGKFIFTFTTVNTTPTSATVTYSSDQGVPAGSLSSVSAPNPGSSVVAAGSTRTQPVFITAIINSNGTLTATATYNAHVISCSAPFTANALPYFQVWNGDASAGGGFASPNNNPFTNTPLSCGNSGDPPYVSAGASGYGGSIVGFGKQSSNRGSRTDFGAIAMGTIPGQPTGPLGFFSGDVSSGKRPVFANNIAGYGSTNMGGHLNGGPPNQCVKDYFTDTQITQGPDKVQPYTTDLNSEINTVCPDRCQFKSGSSVIINSTVQVPQGKQVTLFVDGDVTINADILYRKDFDPSSQNNIPYLAIIARGNITLSSGVSELDGLYVAQPQPPNYTSGGNFYTCVVGSHCNNQLVVNGAVVAQRLVLLRSHGTLDAPSSDPGGITGNPAEIFNFVPSMVIGAPALPSQFGANRGTFSLAPVF